MGKRMSSMGLLLGVFGAALGVQAEVVTNHWTNADGGGVCAINSCGRS